MKDGSTNNANPSFLPKQRKLPVRLKEFTDFTKLDSCRFSAFNSVLFDSSA